MAEGRNIFVGILAILLGLFVIIFPLISVSTFSVLTGIGIIFLGIWLLIQSFKVWRENLAAGIADLILGFFALCFGIVFIGNIAALSFLTFLALYIVGFFLLLTGITALFSGADLKARGVGVLGIVFGIIYLLLGIYVGNPLFLAIIIGAFLIIAGLMEIFAPPQKNLQQ
jgi:membrane protein HdeD